MKRIFGCGVLLMSFAALTAQLVTAQATDSAKTKAESLDIPTSPFLAALASIPAWALKLQTYLRNMGATIDRSKAINALLPKIEAVQQDLSDLEDLNEKLDKTLAQASYDYYSLQYTVAKIGEKLQVLTSLFKEIRSSVQVLSIPELTDFERAGEAAVAGKGIAVDELMVLLGYQKGTSRQPAPTKAELQARGKHLDDLLHQAQDAFGQLHSAMKNPDKLDNTDSKKTESKS